MLLFLPFGFLGYLSVIDKKAWWKGPFVTALGALLSFNVECLQVFSLSRCPAASDVLTNTLGSALGVIACMKLRTWVNGLRHRPAAGRLLASESIYPAFIFVALASAGSLEPFDLTLDVGLLSGKAKEILRHPFDLKWPHDDLLTFIHYFLVSLFLCRLAGEAGSRSPRWTGFGMALALGWGMEALQFIVVSRATEFQDVVVILMAVAGGVIAFGFPGYRERPLLWSLAAAALIFASVLVRELYPFRFTVPPGAFNWLPFRPDQGAAGFAALAEFIESAMAYFPFGFLLAYFFPGARTAAWAALLGAAAMAAAVETAQGFVLGRHGNVTDVLGALMGCWAGYLGLARGRGVFREYTSSEAPRPDPAAELHR